MVFLSTQTDCRPDFDATVRVRSLGEVQAPAAAIESIRLLDSLPFVEQIKKWSYGDPDHKSQQGGGWTTNASVRMDIETVRPSERSCESNLLNVFGGNRIVRHGMNDTYAYSLVLNATPTWRNIQSGWETCTALLRRVRADLYDYPNECRIDDGAGGEISVSPPIKSIMRSLVQLKFVSKLVEGASGSQDEAGRFSFEIDLSADAEQGRHFHEQLVSIGLKESGSNNEAGVLGYLLEGTELDPLWLQLHQVILSDLD